MVAVPADYRWSSHRANACGNHDPVVTPHPLFLALAPSAEERRDVYRRSFGLLLPEETVKAIRDATQFEWALGDASFRTRVEASTGRRTDRLPMGRPRTSREPKSRL
jgi:putative transposase